MARLGKPALALTALLATVFTPVKAWAPQTRIRLAEEAVRLMPSSLRLALLRHRESLLRGALEPLSREDGREHLPPWDGGTLDAEIAGQAEALVESIDRPLPFAEVARHFGALAHFVADAGFPPGAAGKTGKDHYSEFAEFCESRRRRFPLVFYGHEDKDFDSGDARSFAQGVLSRARDEDRGLARAYREWRLAPDPSAFDDRSVPFAIASLSYSRTVTDIVRAWLSAWGRAHGDLGLTPYLAPPTRRALEGER